MQPLAIVIPAYKAAFLDETLRSIAAQTCRDFTVYVGDDASPQPVAAVCERWAPQLELRYTRFEHNLGGRDLVAQWSRCVALSAEPWVWLFGDDDVMPPDAVARLLAATRRDGSALLRFDVDRIDADGRLITAEPAFPPQLSAREFARRRLRFELSSYAPEVVFSRSAYERSGGFVPFPRAWCSDDATWLRLGARHGIRTLPGARVGWRSSGLNISARHGDDAAEKVEAQVAFLRWLDGFLHEHPAAAGEPDDGTILREALPWFFGQARFLGVRFEPPLARAVVQGLAGVRGCPVLPLRWGLLRANLRLAYHAARQRRRQGR